MKKDLGAYLLIFSSFLGLSALSGYALNIVDPLNQPQSMVALLFPLLAALIAHGCVARFLIAVAQVRDLPLRNVYITASLGMLIGWSSGFLAQSIVLAR